MSQHSQEAGGPLAHSPAATSQKINYCGVKRLVLAKIGRTEGIGDLIRLMVCSISQEFLRKNTAFRTSDDTRSTAERAMTSTNCISDT